jgi:hypothetical protein
MKFSKRTQLKNAPSGFPCDGCGDFVPKNRAVYSGFKANKKPISRGFAEDGGHLKPIEANGCTGGTLLVAGRENKCQVWGMVDMGNSPLRGE